MRRLVWMAAAAAVILSVAPAFAQEHGAAPTTQPAAAGTVDGGLGRGLALIGVCLGAGLTVVGGGMGISNIGCRATESIARQPEAAGRMFLAWLLTAAMIEGAMLFGVLTCFLAMSNLFK